jgi:uncharacterized phage protein (TIGR02220 family)
MGRDPAFLFYPGDWDGGTKLFNRYEKGAYIDLLMCQFHNGHMTKENLVFILGQADYDLYWESQLKTKFLQDDEGKFYNQKLESEQIKRRKWCESRANNKEGINQYSGHMTTHMRGHTVGHMENVNENVNRDIKDIVLYLNAKAGKQFSVKTKNTISHISARLAEGRTIDDFKKVIDIKCSKWMNDPKMKDYLRPDTLFGTKFESYLNENMDVKSW